MIAQPIYQLRPQEVLQALETSPAGIHPADAGTRQALYGKNILSEERRPKLWRRFANQAIHPFSALLWIAGMIALLAGETVLAGVSWILVWVNAAFALWRENRTEQAMQALRRLLPAFARVVRDGVEIQIPVEDLVPGDILILAEGDNIPADGRVIEAYGLRVSQVALTGEAIPARRTADASFQDNLSELERPNLVFAGTMVVSGTGRAAVYATGMLTQFGRIAHLTQTAKEEISPFQAELLRISRRIALAAIGVSIFVFVIGLSDVGLGILEAFLLALGILVAAIPEGLPAIATLSLAVAGQRLAQKGVLVKRLAAIETLGTLSVICTDKSGTLTQNQMTVRELWISGRKLSVSGVGYEPQGKLSPDLHGTPAQPDLELLLAAASLCNNARLSPPSPDKPYWHSLGDQTEAALRVAAIKAGVDERTVAQCYPRIHELPFDARRKRMSTIHLSPDHVAHPKQGTGVLLKQPAAVPGAKIAFIKGAPREILDLCTQVHWNGELQPLGEPLRQQIRAVNDGYASQALRVLALAYRDLPPKSGSYTPEKVEQGLTFLGLMAMHDPPRPDVEDAVRICKEAGIRMVMITGDYGLTAATLARRVGMIASFAPRIVTGAELEKLSEPELVELLDQEIVFSRMAPEHKLRLVAAFQAKGEVVAVTGDGVNDAPALRKADIGVAMGITGTDVAREAADIVLVDDHFAHLVTAIEEGRAVYENLRKFITYIFSSNVPEILPFLITSLFNLPLALTVRQVLAIDLGSDLLPGLALGTEPPEPGLLKQPPRRRSQPLIDGPLLRRAFLWLGPLEALLAYSGFFLVYALFSPNPDWEGMDANEHLLAVSVFHAGVVMAQVGNAFACRTATQRGRTLGWFKNLSLWLAVGAAVGIILVLIYIPPLTRAFNHMPIPGMFWLWLGLYPFIFYGLDWTWKIFLRRFRKKVEDPS